MASRLSTASLARMSARAPWRVVIVWVGVLVVFMGIAGTYLEDGLTTVFKITNNADSVVADDLLKDRLGRERQATDIVIVRSEAVTVDDAAFQSKVEAIFGTLAGLGTDKVQNPIHYYITRDDSFVSADRSTTIIPFTLAGDLSTAGDHILDVRDAMEQYLGDPDFEVLLTGPATVGLDFQEISQEDLESGESIGIPAALIILILVFGALVAAIIPIIVAVVSIVIAFGLTALVGQTFELSLFVTNIIVMIGLPVGIDYCLFIVQRFREERAKGFDKITAVTNSGSTAGRAVFFSGMTVLLALAGMLIIPHNVFRSLGTGAILVVFVSVLASLTLLPALLSLLGDKVNRLRVPIIGGNPGRSDESARGGFWDRVSGTVMKRPIISLVLAAGILAVAAIPYFSINTGAADVATFPDNLDSNKRFVILAQEFADLQPNRTEVVIDGPIDDPRVQDSIARLTSLMDADDSFGATRLEQHPESEIAILSAAVKGGDATSDAAVTAVKRLRREHVPEAFAVSPARALVAGQTAFNIDFFRVSSDYMPIVFAFVLGTSFVLLTVVFRSIVIAVKSIILNLLSVGAAYGLIVLVFQEGFAADFFGFTQTETIEAWLPLFLFSILFGLSMDYHVFLLSRIRENFDKTGDNKGSIAFGIRSTGRLITGAALIMVTVFGAFAAGSMAPLQQMGFGLGVAVLIDATIVRMVLVPSAMAILGDANWYLPSWLNWLPDLRVEAAEPAPAVASDD